MTDIVKAPPFMPSKPQWDATVKLLERALEELAQAQAERDAARAEVARLTAAGDGMERVINDNGYEPDSKFEYAVARWAALRQPAPDPAQPDATMLSDNSLQTSSQAPAQGQG